MASEDGTLIIESENICMASVVCLYKRPLESFYRVPRLVCVAFSCIHCVCLFMIDVQFPRCAIVQ